MADDNGLSSSGAVAADDSPTVPVENINQHASSNAGEAVAEAREHQLNDGIAQVQTKQAQQVSTAGRGASSSSPSALLQLPASLQPRNSSPPSPTSSSSPPVQPGRGSPGLSGRTMGREADSRGSREARSSVGVDTAQLSPTTDHGSALPVVATPAVSNVRNRVRAPATSLPGAFPPPARVHADSTARQATINASGREALRSEEGSSTSSHASLDVTGGRSHGSAGLRPGETQDLEESTNGGDELELSVPSHQEHLTSDGQRCWPLILVQRALSVIG